MAQSASSNDQRSAASPGPSACRWRGASLRKTEPKLEVHSATGVTQRRGGRGLRWGRPRLLSGRQEHRPPSPSHQSALRTSLRVPGGRGAPGVRTFAFELEGTEGGELAAAVKAREARSHRPEAARDSGISLTSHWAIMNDPMNQLSAWGGVPSRRVVI